MRLKTARVPDSLLVDTMFPNALLLPRRVRTCIQNHPHLLSAHIHCLPSHPPPLALGARRRGQASLVRPELLEVRCTGRQRLQVEGRPNELGRLSLLVLHVWLWKRSDEPIHLVPGLDQDGEDGSFPFLVVAVH